jgi:hypothetical protein
MDLVDRSSDGFGRRIAMDDGFRHRALARRNWTVGLWAGSLMGLDAVDAEALANVLVEEEPDDDAIAKALGAEFLRARVDVPERRIRRKMAEDLARAAAEVANGR